MSPKFTQYFDSLCVNLPTEMALHRLHIWFMEGGKKVWRVSVALIKWNNQYSLVSENITIHDATLAVSKLDE